VLGIAEKDMRAMIREGADIIMKQVRSPLMPNFTYGRPPGVTICHDEGMLEVYLAGMIAKNVRAGEFRTIEFCYPALQASRIMRYSCWREMESGLNRHKMHGILLVDHDIYCFDELDWSICQVKIGIGFG